MTEAPLVSAAARGTAAVTVDTLSGALSGEVRLLDDLTSILRRQREGVATDDVQMVDDCVFAAHRMIRTIEEARRRRRTLIAILLGAGDVPPRELPPALGVRATADLVAAVDRLHAAAGALSREIEINRHVLRGAIDAGDRVVRALCGARSGPVSYDATARAVPASAGGGALFNQQV